MGTPEFAVPSLRAVARSCDVAAVVTRPDRPRGRGRASSDSPVAAAGSELGLPVIKPERLHEPECMDRMRSLGADLFAVVAFGAILKPELLAVPRLGSINLHGSMLPEYRGASPVQRALWDGRAATGVSTMWMDEGIDTGDLILQRWAAIEPSDHAGSLSARLADLGAPLLAQSLTLAHAGSAPRVSQPATGSSYAPRLAKHDGHVDWALDVQVVWNRQRSVTPWPGATARFREHPVLLTSSVPLHRLRQPAPPGTIVGASAEGVDVACATGVLRVLRLKPEGRAEMSAADWARGVRLEAAERFESMKVAT